MFKNIIKIIDKSLLTAKLRATAIFNWVSYYSQP